MDPLFLSIIIPIYNAETHLPECLDSIVNQDISPAEYEIICVNDGSKDNSLSILKHYSENHCNIRIIDKENGGVTTARNAGLEAAEGSYIWFVDADDFLKDNILQKLRTRITEENNPDRLIVGCYTFEDQLTEAEQEGCHNNTLSPNGPGQDSVVGRTLFRRAFLREHELYFCHPELTHGEDGLFMYEAGAFHPSSAEITEPVYFYRVHSGSADTAMTPAGLQKKLRSYVRITEIMKGYYQDSRRDAATANVYMTFLWFSLLTCASLPPKLSRETKRQLKKAGLFPGKWLPECTLTCSYMVSTDSLVGKIYDQLYLNLHTRWGYAGIWLIRQLLRLKRKLHK